MGYNNKTKATPPGLGGWTYQGDVALGDPPAGSFYVDQTSMASGTPTIEINVTDSKGISHLDWLQDLVDTNHLILRNRVRPSDSLIIELSSNTPGAGFQTLVGTITSGSGTFLVGATYDIWAVTTVEEKVVGPASSLATSVPTFSDTTGKVIQHNTGLQYDTGEVQLASATSAIEIEERATAPASATAKGHVWVKDDAPNTLTFTDDLGTDIPIVPPNTVVLGEWTFGGSSLGVTALGEFETNNATLALITSFRFNSNPNSGQSTLTWAGLLPQEGILYLQDISDPGVNNVTFPYLSITFPLGGGWPQFNGNILATDGVDLGTNWSANDYSLQIVATAPSLDRVVNAVGADNDVIVSSTDPIILRDNAVDFTPLTIIGTQTAVSAAMEIERDTTTAVALRVSTESIVPPDYIARWDSTTSDGMTFTTSEVVGDIATWQDETATFTFDDVLTNDPVWDVGQVFFDGSSGLLVTDGGYVASSGTWILCTSFDGVASHDYMLGTPSEIYIGNQGGTDEKIEFVMNTGGSPIYKSATDLTDEPVVVTVTNNHIGADDNDKVAWLGTTKLGESLTNTDANSDNNTLTLGYAVSSAQATVGYMYELIIYDRVLTDLEIADVTNYLSLKWTAQNSDSLSSVSTSTTSNSLSLTAGKIVPGAAVTNSSLFEFFPQSTSHASYHGVDIVISGGDHSGSLRGGNLTLDAGASTSGTNGIVRIGFLGITEEIIVGSATTPGVTITEGTDHPAAPAAGRAQIWVKSDYLVPTTSPIDNDGQVLMMTDDTGLDIDLSWLAANYKARIGGQLAFAHIEENATFAGGTAKATGDGSISFIYDHLSNMWYQAWVDAGTLDAQVTSSSDGGYTWQTATEVDTSLGVLDLSQPCTNGTNLGIAADGYFYLSTSLNSSDLPGSFTGKATNIIDSTGLVWSEQQSLWVMCGDGGTNGHIYTSPDGSTWTDRTPAGMTTDKPVSMDIAHFGFGGYTGTERIIIVCGSYGTQMWYSLNGGLNWTEDTSNVPAIGCETIMWCPSIPGSSATATGAWLGVDASSNLYYSINNTGTYWLDSNLTARCLWRTPEMAGYGNSSANQTWYQFTSVSDATTRGYTFVELGATWQNQRAMHGSNQAINRARYQWGNGVIMFDRLGDAELMIGRYGPIEPV